MSKIGIVKATALVASNMIGSGALLTPALLAPFGSFAFVGWMITTFGALALALCFSKLSEWLPGAGGPYSYIKQVFGDFMGFQMSWGYWFSSWCGSVSLVIGALSYLSIFYPEIASNCWLSIPIGLSMIWIFTFINMRGINESATVSVIILAVKVLPLVLFAVVGVFYFDSNMAFKPIDFKNLKDIAVLSMFQPLLWAFIGLESATVPAASVKNPKKTIPIATISGVIITAIIYIVGSIVICGVLPYQELLISRAPYVDAAKHISGNYGGMFMIVTGLIGLIGSLNGWILIHGQVSYAAARDGLFPSLFNKVNKHGAPIGVVIGSILMSVLFIASYKGSLNDQISILIDISVFAMTLPYFYCVMAVIYVGLTKRSEFSLKEKISLNIITIAASIYSFAAIFSSGTNIIFYGFLIFVLITPLYLSNRFSRK